MKRAVQANVLPIFFDSLYASILITIDELPVEIMFASKFTQSPTWTVYFNSIASIARVRAASASDFFRNL